MQNTFVKGCVGASTNPSLTPSSYGIAAYSLFVRCIVGLGRLGCILVRLCCLRRRLHRLPLHSRCARLQCCITYCCIAKALAASLKPRLHRQIFRCIVESLQHLKPKPIS
ncbi:hypothetical protein BHM03_00043317 [Ensete ventricosum]|nr:hypothetical protein BHM03_00043317 [Ensete ventricosum]